MPEILQSNYGLTIYRSLICERPLDTIASLCWSSDDLGLTRIHKVGSDMFMGRREAERAAEERGIAKSDVPSYFTWVPALDGKRGVAREKWLREHDTAADLFDQAADALVAGNVAQCRELIKAADMPVLWAHAHSLVGPINPKIHRQSRMPRTDTNVPKEALASARMPSRSLIGEVYERDGHRCRYCGTRVIVPEARKVFQTLMPDVARWGSANKERHSGFYALNASLDHVLPHRRGGSNELDNVVTACWPCQFGRSNWLLSEVEILAPFTRPPLVDRWDGLKRVLSIKHKR